MREEMLQAFWAFVNERHAMWVRRQLLDRGICNPSEWCPWPVDAVEGFSMNEAFKTQRVTTDLVLAQYRFCNVFRELDRVTVWIRQNIREPFADHPNLWFMLAIARTINWPETLQWLMDQHELGHACWPRDALFTPAALGMALDRYSAAGNKVYTGAYMIRAESNPKAEWYSWTKQQYIAQIVLGRLWEDRESWGEYLEPASTDGKHPTLFGVWGSFQEARYIGWGPFMAGQVVTDLRHTRLLRAAPDLNRWTALGPGSTRGLNRLHGREVTVKLSQGQGLVEMMELYEGQGQHRASWVPPIELSDIQNCLCEFDKYQRAKLGEGRPRAMYVPGRGW